MKQIQLPLTKEAVAGLRAGDNVRLSGPLYTGRDAAHKRLFALLKAGEPLPVDLAGQTIYYVGPAPAGPGHPVGSAGPTSSYRMDAYAPLLMRSGLRGMMGKGYRGQDVVRAMVQYGCVYFGAVGGAAAYLSKRIIKSEVVAYEDLGTEAIHRFTLQDFPAVVLIDAQGRNLYELGREQYLSAIAHKT